MNQQMRGKKKMIPSLKESFPRKDEIPRKLHWHPNSEPEKKELKNWMMMRRSLLVKLKTKRKVEERCLLEALKQQRYRIFLLPADLTGCRYYCGYCCRLIHLYFSAVQMKAFALLFFLSLSVARSTFSFACSLFSLIADTTRRSDACAARNWSCRPVQFSLLPPNRPPYTETFSLLR